MLDPPDDRLQRALDLAYAYVNRRERTIGEVRRHLEGRTIAEPLIDAAIEALAEHGFVDDVRFARLFITDKRELEQWGSERIRRGLLARGIERELADRALKGGGGGGDPEDELSDLDRALALLRRRFPEPPRERRERERALGVLLRKGYESELALDALHAHGGDGV